MSIHRRDVLAAAGAAVAVGLAGCTSLIDSAEPAHTVSVYLADRERNREVTVTVTDDRGTTVFEQEYNLSDSNEADEDATFPAADTPESIVVTVDGTRFERNWPGFEHPDLPCDDPNNAGIEIWVEQTSDGSPEIRLEANCQSVTIDN